MRRPPLASGSPLLDAAFLVLVPAQNLAWETCHPGWQPLLPGPAEAAFTVTAADQGSGAASTVSPRTRCRVTGQPFTVLILAPPGRPAGGANVSVCSALTDPSDPSAAAADFVQVHGSVDHLMALDSVVEDAVGSADPGGIVACFTDGGTVWLAARVAVAAGKIGRCRGPHRAA